MFLLNLDLIRSVATGAALAVLDDDARVGDAAAGAARLHRPQHRQAAAAAREGRRSAPTHVVLAPLEPPRPALPVARARSRRSALLVVLTHPGVLAAARLRRRGQPAGVGHQPQRLRPAGRRASVPGSTAPLLVAAEMPDGAIERATLQTLATRLDQTPRASASRRRRSRAPTAQAALIIVTPSEPRRRTAHQPTSCTGCATTSFPRRSRGTPVVAKVTRRERRGIEDFSATSAAGCRSFFAARAGCCRSCC